MTLYHGRSALAIAAMAALGGLANIGPGEVSGQAYARAKAVAADQSQLPQRGVLSPSLLAILRGGGGGWGGRRNNKRGPGWSFAQVKRMSRKQKNRSMHRAKAYANGGRARA